jgi:hypothetical protein
MGRLLARWQLTDHAGSRNEEGLVIADRGALLVAEGRHATYVHASSPSPEGRSFY